MKKTKAIFSILMGTALIGTWLVLFVLGNVPELATSPLEIGLLLVAEFLTGASLIVGGSGLLARARWGMPLELVALGMLLYVSTYYTGILGQEGNAPAAVFMAMVAVLTLASLGYAVPAASGTRVDRPKDNLGRRRNSAGVINDEGNVPDDAGISHNHTGIPENVR
jgi:hypothetical protein